MTMIRSFLALILIAALFTGAVPARADEAPAIQAVIKRQIEAFRQGDAGAAFALASNNIREIFGTPEGFMAMVRQGYPVLLNPRRVAFMELIEDDGRTIQRALVEDAGGGLMMAVYPMQRLPDGTWRIDGCALVAVPSNPA